MATKCSEEAILNFLKDRGGRVKNADLIEHFKAVFPEEPEKKAAVRKLFKQYVDNIAFVKAESEVKYVCLKKKFCRSLKVHHRCIVLNDEKDIYRPPVGSRNRQVSDAQLDPVCQQQTLPCSGYENDSNVLVTSNFPTTNKDNYRGKGYEFVCEEEDVDSSSTEMGNTESIWSDKKFPKKEQPGKEPDIPENSVIKVLPLPAQGSVFTLLGPVQTGSTRQADTAPAGLSPTYRHVETRAERNRVVTRTQTYKGRQSTQLDKDNLKDEAQFDMNSQLPSPGSEDKITTKCRHFLQATINTFPKVRQSMVLQNSVSRHDSDSASLVSSSLDDDRASVTLDPLEHEWMMCASDGEWGKMHRLLTTEPTLILRKDFITGFTCLHWAAKQGKPELMALILNFAKQHNIPISVDVRSNTGYTPLHIAVMHNHIEVVKLLVGAYNADVEIRDYSGRKACQYLTNSVSMDVRDIIGAYEQPDSQNTDHRKGGRWRLSKVLQTNLKPFMLLSTSDCDAVETDDHPSEKPLRRQSSLSRMKPKMQKLRMRTSQIVHSTSFHDTEEMNGSRKASFKSRPKTQFFGRDKQ
ncbi:ankyrin repeat domain-containing protein SOWAHC-like [Channa argus]|uniref:ankyrin repeat domain-containing protein SOWAHC-like n=1 Tax=Channa argus TaxID=215402 RepID=UPI0029480E60|nr:hypothetical protein Q8A73_022905 [Channa argus]